MVAILTVSYLLVIGLLGYAGISVLFGPKRRPWYEVAALAFAAGCGLLSLILFLASLAGIAPNRMLIALVAAGAIGSIAILRARRSLILFQFPQRSALRWNPQTILGALAALAIATAVLNVAVRSLTPGLADIDSYAIWMFKAKMVEAQPLMPIPPMLLTPGLSYSHQDYPLGFPLLISGIPTMIGSFDDQAGKAILLPLYLSLIGISYAVLRQMHRPWIALSITAAFIAAPILMQHAAMPMAELPLLVFFIASSALLLRWMQNGQGRDLVAAMVFGAFAAFTKNEGLAVLVLFALIGLAFTLFTRSKQRLQAWACSTALALLILLPWLIYRIHLPHTHEDYGSKLTRPSTLLADLPRLRQVVPHFFEQMLEFQNAGFLWLLLALSAVLGWRAFQRLPILALWGLLIAQLFLYIVTLMVTPWDLALLLPMISPKLLMQVSPLAVLLIGAHLRETPVAGAHSPT